MRRTEAERLCLSRRLMRHRDIGCAHQIRRLAFQQSAALNAAVGRLAMGLFGPKGRRTYATPLQPVIDPAGWEPEAIAMDTSWAYVFTASDLQEIASAV